MGAEQEQGLGGLDTRCPYCGEELRGLDSQYRGKGIRCKFCGAAFIAFDDFGRKIQSAPEKEQEPEGMKPEAVQKTLSSKQKLVERIEGGEVDSRQIQKNSNKMIKSKKTLFLAAAMFIGSALAFIGGISAGEDRHIYEYSSEYNYYGDLIPHLHYKATLELLAEAKEIKHQIQQETATQKANLLFLLSGCLFAGGSIVVAIRECQSKVASSEKTE